MADSRLRCIRVTLAPGVFQVAVKSDEVGVALDLIQCDYAGPEIRFAVNGHYVKQFLELAGDGRGAIKVEAPDKMIRFETPGWAYCVMPMRG